MSVSNNNANIDIVNSTGVSGALTVGTTSVELKVGGSALAERQAITIQPKDNGVFFGYSLGVTTSTGTELFKDQFLVLPIGANIPVYLIATGEGKNVRIGELA